MRIKFIIILILFISSGIFYYNITGNSIREKSTVFVVRVIDGDTFETDAGQKVRMLGINTPEKKMFLYDESKNFLRERVENRTIEIESYGTDKYGRTLAHVFLKDLHINEELLKNGHASLYYYEKDSYYKSLLKAEEFARLNEIGIWEKSLNENCINLIELKYKEDGERCTNGEILKLQNICDKEISLTIKDDATHIYEEKIRANSLFTKNFSCIWNDEGDSLFIWDKDGLVLFWRY
jgi:endonuclease YncB( thermonuclease family)